MSNLYYDYLIHEAELKPEHSKVGLCYECSHCHTPIPWDSVTAYQSTNHEMFAYCPKCGFAFTNTKGINYHKEVI